MCAAAPGPGWESWRGRGPRFWSGTLESRGRRSARAIPPCGPHLHGSFPLRDPGLLVSPWGFCSCSRSRGPPGSWRPGPGAVRFPASRPHCRRRGVGARDSAPGLGARPRAGGPLRLGRLLLPMPHGGGAHPVVWLLSTPGSQGPSTRAGRPDPLQSAPAGGAVHSNSL